MPRERAINDLEKLVCEKLARGLKTKDIAEDLGCTKQWVYQVRSRPHVKEYLKLLSKKTIDKETDALAEAAARKRVLSTEMADDRLTELLKARRFTMSDRALLRMAGNSDSDGEAPAVPDEAPIEDTALLKAVELTYKKLNVLGGNSTTVNLQNNTQVQVYQSKWKQPVEAEIVEAVPLSLPGGDSQ